MLPIASRGMILQSLLIACLIFVRIRCCRVGSIEWGDRSLTMHVLTSKEMQWVDQQTTEQCGIPSLQLMESAAFRIVEFIVSRFGEPRDQLIVVVCGKGNNGGDGAASARMLVGRGAHVEMFMMSNVEATQGDARINFERAQLLAHDNERLKIHLLDHAGKWEVLEQLLPQCWLVLDALLGTGLELPASEPYARAIGQVNRAREERGLRTLAVDLPSGLAADNDQVIGPTISADFTVTFTAPKPAVVLPPACYHAGRLEVVDIGSPGWLVETLHPKLHVTQAEDVRVWLFSTRRSDAGHKGTYGHVLIVGGSRGKVGAAILSAEAVLRAGGGLVTVATPSSVETIPVTVHPEIMTMGLRETPEGGISEEETEHLIQLARSRDLIALGPGVGTNESTKRVVRQLVSGRNCRMIIDADGLNCLSPWPEDLDDPARPLILTPHPAEMARLLGVSTGAVLEDRVRTSRSFAQKHGLYLVLKGSRSLIATPEGDVFINPTGNAGLATAGSGDVLTGILGGFLAAPSADIATGVAAGVYLHGLAGELASTQFGLRGVLASDITAHLPESIRRVAGGQGEFGVL